MVATSISGGNTILTVTDETTGTHESVTLAGTAANGFNWAADYDGARGADVFDPPVTDSGVGLQISDANPSIALINNGHAVEIVGGVALHLDAPSSQTFVFGDAASLIFIDQPADFTGHIGNFTGTDATHSNVIDLSGIDFKSAQFAETYHATTGVLSVTDGANSASFTFDNFQGALDFASDGHGGTTITDVPVDAVTNPLSTAAAQGTLSFADNDAASNLSTTVTPEGQNYVGHLTTSTVMESSGNASVDYGFSLGNDQINVASGQTVTQSYQVSLTDAQNPSANATQTVAVTIGGAGNDNFVFAPGVGHDTVLNFNAQQDTVELDHFADAQTVQQVQALIKTDVHSDAVIDLGNHDSVTFANTTSAQLQQAIQAGHLLLH
jgi:hypothetical protein